MAFGSSSQDVGSGGGTLSEINMVPLIDVMLVLLVIFMITAPMLTHSLQIDLPKASSSPVEQEPDVIDLAIDDSGQVFWNEDPIDLATIKKRFEQEADADPQPTLHLRADKLTRYEVLAEVMAMAKSAGLEKMGFVTRPDETTASEAKSKSK